MLIYDYTYFALSVLYSYCNYSFSPSLTHHSVDLRPELTLMKHTLQLSALYFVVRIISGVNVNLSTQTSIDNLVIIYSTV